MTTALFKDGFPSAHRNTRQRIESRIDLRGWCISMKISMC
jgi:hypothetical protein